MLLTEAAPVVRRHCLTDAGCKQLNLASTPTAPGAPAMLGSSSGNGQRDVAALQQQINVKDQQLRTLAGTLQHYRCL